MLTNEAQAVEQKIHYMLKGDTFVYHVGHLAKDRAKSMALSYTADAVWRAYKKGTLVLFQKRVDTGFAYMAMRTAK
jgi:hypothetical protein